MKRFCLTILFACYYFFMPFVMVNCSSADEPYALDPEVLSASESADDELLRECQEMEFLIESCIDILQAESERVAGNQVAVSTANDSISDFEDCKAEDSISASNLVRYQETEDESSDDSDTESDTECESVLTDMVAAYQVCTDNTDSNSYEGCSDVVDAIDQATFDCDNGETSVTDDFCQSLTA